MMRIVPVTGDWTEAEKNAAIDKMTIFDKYSGPTTPSCIRTMPTTLPVRAPSTSMGRKNPPGAPQP